MRRPERVDPGIVDQHIDLAVAELDGASGHFASARRVSKVRRKKIRFASCGMDVRNRLLPARRIATYDDDMHTKLGQFIGDARPIPLVPPVTSAVNALVAMCNVPCQILGLFAPYAFSACRAL